MMRIVEKIRQKNENYHLSSTPTIVFLGDSVTHGCFEIIEGAKGTLEVVCDFEAVYHNQLKKILSMVFPFAPINIVNAGISGDTSQGGLQRLERDVLKFNPDLVVVCYGLNDSNKGKDYLNEYLEGLAGIFLELKKNDIEVIFLTPNMKNTYISPAIKSLPLIEMAKLNMESQINGTLDLYIYSAKELCQKEKVVVCDCYEKWKKLYYSGVDTTSLLSNFINHPNRPMHKLFAWSLFETIMFQQ